MKKLPVYNLEFESHCHRMEIGGYVFERADDYEQRLKSLHHSFPHTHEFSISPNTGTHVETAVVLVPKKESNAVLGWFTPQSALRDLTLLLSLFTSRDVFVLGDDEQNGAIIRDPRGYRFGRSLRTSVPYKPSCEDFLEAYDVGAIEAINRILLLIRSRAWRRTYHKGYFLFLAREVFQFQSLEKAFTSAWTLWEHLYYIHNFPSLTSKQIYKMEGAQKVAFLLAEYGFTRKLVHGQKECIRIYLTNPRNDIVHEGRFRSARARRDAVMFIDLTAQLVAVTLGLTPTDVMCSRKKLSNVLRRKIKP